METTTERLVKMSYEQQKSLLRYFSRCPPDTCIEILQNKQAAFHSLRQNYSNIDKGAIEYCALILSIKDHYDQEQSLRNKSFSGLEIEEIRNISRKKADQFIRKIRKPDPKREKLLTYWAIIRTLKLEQKFSFRQISLFLKRYHRADFAHSTIYKVWNELEETKKEEK